MRTINLIDKEQDDSLLGDELLELLLKQSEMFEAFLDLCGRNLLLLQLPHLIAKLEGSMDLPQVIQVARPRGDLLGIDTGVGGPELLLLEEEFVVSLGILETKLKINKGQLLDLLVVFAILCINLIRDISSFRVLEELLKNLEQIMVSFEILWI